MRSTVVPAQVTTVEDRIAGNLGLSQLLLLLIPVFAGSILYVLLPPFFGYHEYKVVLLVLLATVCGTLAIRIKGQILLLWIIAIVKYNRRPRYFVYSKNSTHTREQPLPLAQEAEQSPEPAMKASLALPQLSTAELVRVEEVLTNPQAKVHFTTNRKGELRVHVTEV